MFCSSQYPVQNYRVYLGNVFRTPNDTQRVLRTVLKAVLHNQYRKFYGGFDIAVLTLSEPVAFNDYVRPICLPSDVDIFTSSSLCYTSGYGYTNFYGNICMSTIVLIIKIYLINF